jgi:hypothetical protein
MPHQVAEAAKPSGAVMPPIISEKPKAIVGRLSRLLQLTFSAERIVVKICD